MLKVRQALAEAEARETQLKQTAETARLELRQSLGKIVALENELALARQPKELGSSSRRARRVSQRRLENPNREGFFGVFNFAPYRGGYRRSARSY